MKKLTFFIILVGISISLKSQVSDSYSLSLQNVEFQQREVNGVVYDVILTKESTCTDEVGNPKLPVKIISYVLPYNSTVTGIDVSVTLQKLQRNYYIIPAQYPRALDGSDPPPFVEPDLAVYSSNTPYPNKTIEIVDDGYLYGYKTFNQRLIKFKTKK